MRSDQRRSGHRGCLTTARGARAKDGRDSLRWSSHKDPSPTLKWQHSWGQAAPAGPCDGRQGALHGRIQGVGGWEGGGAVAAAPRGGRLAVSVCAAGAPAVAGPAAAAAARNAPVGVGIVAAAPLRWRWRALLRWGGD